MLRQVSSRNHRSKGFKLKNALQLCLLVVVTIWLLYQVKHSYDKKTRYEEREERNAHLSIKHDDGDRRPNVFKFPSRKDLPRKVGRTEDEASEGDEASEDDELLEQELLKREESDERDAIDEQDHPESEEADGDELSVFEDVESSKEGAHAAAREESFRGNDIASAVVVHASRPEEHGDHSREAREKSFTGDNVSSAVAHEDHLESAENKAAGGENLTVVDSTSDGTSEFSSDGGSKDREVSSNSTVDEPNNHAEPRVDPTTTNVVGNQTETPTADQEVREKPMNTTTTALNNQIELLTNLTVPDQNETTNLGSGSGSGSGSARDGNDMLIQIPGDDKFNTSSTTSSASSEKGERKVEFQDTTRNMAEEMRDVPNAKIEERAKSGEEVVLE